jgi:nucleotide-binding universal stress UspA family protein
MFGSIVAGTDGSPTSLEAVAKAAELARLTSARLHLVCAFKPATASALAMTGAVPMMISDGADDQARQEAEQALAHVAERIAGSGVAVTTHYRTQSPSGAILDVAESEHADLIVVGNRGMRGARRVLGSVPNSVAHGAHCAVMIINTT